MSPKEYQKAYYHINKKKILDNRKRRQQKVINPIIKTNFRVMFFMNTLPVIKELKAIDTADLIKQCDYLVKTKRYTSYEILP